MTYLILLVYLMQNAPAAFEGARGHGPYRTPLSILFCIALLTALVLLGFLTGPVSAEEINIYPGTSIASTINSAASGDIVVLNPGTYPEHSIAVDKNIIVRANTSSGGSAANTIIDAGVSGRIFSVNGDYTLVIDNLTLTNGYISGDDGGAVSSGFSNSVLFINSSMITNCSSTHYGGAVYTSNKNTTIDSSTFTDCSATSRGGAIYSTGSGMTVIDSTTFTNCQALYGGAIDAEGGSEFRILSSTFFGCSAFSGGAIYTSSSTATISDTTFSNCSTTAGGNGGALAVADSSRTTLIRSSITGASAGNGGAIFLTNAANTLNVDSSFITNCTVTNNAGGIYIYGSKATITNSTIAGCSAAWGGAFTVTGLTATATFNSSKISGCSATNSAGAGHITTGGTATLTDTTVTASKATNGGAFYIDSSGSKATLTSGSVTNNAATTLGSILYATGDVTADIHYSRLYNNTGTTVYQNSGTVNMTYNWWGSNSNTSAVFSGTVASDPWLVLGITANPPTVTPPQTSLITTNLTFDSAGTAHNPFSGHVPDGIPVTFSVSSGAGSVLPLAGNITMGMNRTTFTPGGTGTSLIAATVDGVSVLAPVTVTEGGGAGPVANFTATPTSGAIPLAVTFTDTSQINPTAWNWSFGDGNFSSTQNPSHTYHALGSFTVTLNVTNASGSSTLVRSDFITVSAPSDWAIETVDDTGNVGDSSSLKLDTGSFPHISYTDASNFNLKYAVWTGSAWALTTVDAGGDVEHYQSLALDSNGRPHISYSNVSNGGLNYAAWNGATWSIEQVDAEGTVGLHNSIALDNADNPRIAYIDDSDPVRGGLNFAEKNGGVWTNTTVDAGGSGPVSLALNSSGFARISYYNSLGGDLKYAAWNGAEWVTETVDSDGIVGDASSLALDAGGNPRISYYDTTNSDLKYAAWNGTGWEISTVDSTSLVGLYNSLALNASGYPGISYYDSSSQTLRYAAWSGTAWATEIVDSTGFAGNTNSLALDSDGKPHISYYDTTNGALRYAKTGAEKGPVVLFSGTPVTGTAPLEVTFTDLSAGSPTAWTWSFGDGNFSTLQNPVHTYAFAGTFTVSLNATNASGSRTLARPGYIRVSSPRPVVNFEASPTSGIEPLEVSFTDLSGSATGWAWFFGDENYTAPWRLMNPDSGWAQRYGQTSVTMPDGSIVLMGGQGTENLNDTWRSDDSGATWAAMNSSSGWPARYSHTSIALQDGRILLMGGMSSTVGTLNDTWISADRGASWTLVNASAGWPSRRNHNSVAMPDGSIIVLAGDSGTPYKNDTWRSVDNGDTWSLMSAEGSWAARQSAGCVAMPDGSIILAGGRLDGDVPANDVWQSDDYGATWSLINASADWTPRYEHTLVTLPDASILLMGGMGAGGNTNDAWRSADNGYSWSPVNTTAAWTGRSGHTGVLLPDGGIVLMGGSLTNDTWMMNPAGSLVQNPVHTYTKPGTYRVSLQAYHADNYNSTRKNAFITVTGSVPPVADFIATPLNGSIPLEVTFTDLARAGIINWNWSFGDGTFSESQNPVHTYESSGTYTVTLNVTNASGTNSIVRNNLIRATYPRPVTQFTPNITRGTVPLTVRFSDLSLNSPTGWAWFFGDERYSAPWTQVNASAGWTGRYSHTSVALPDGSIILSGGQTTENTNDTWRSQDNGNTWTLMNVSSGWPTRYQHASVALQDNSIVLMGGMSSTTGTFNDTWRSTDAGASWVQENASSGWVVRRSLSGVAMPDGSILVMAGEGTNGFLNDTWRSTDNGATWSLMSANAGWVGRDKTGVTAMPDGSIVLAGGRLGTGVESNDVWRSADNGATWTLMNASPGWTPRYLHTMVTMPDSSILLMGGTAGATWMNDVWRSADNGATWTLVNASGWLPTRTGHTTVALKDASIVLMGGGTENDVWTMSPAGSSLQNPVHTYTEPGTYSIALQAYTSDNANSTLRAGLITVDGVTANFTANVTNARPRAAVAFSDISTGVITAWNWSFGDGTYSEEQNPVHQYAWGDTFNVSLTAANVYDSDTRTNPMYITIEPRSTDPIRLIGKNGSVYIGETWLNITESMGTNTTLAWFNPGDDESVTVPVKTLDVSGQERAYTIEPLNFITHPGTWYSWSGGSTKGGAPVAFQVTEPSINFTVTDMTTGRDAGGKTIPVGNQLAFEVNVTVAQGTTEPGVPVRIVIRGPDGRSYTTLTNRSGIIYPLNISVVEPPFATGTIWDTERSLYPVGSYNITAIYDFNEMTETYPVAGRTFALHQTVNISIAPPPELPPPTFTSMIPVSGIRNTTITFAIAGKDFEPGSTTVEFRNQSTGKITAALTNVTATRIDGNITIPGDTIPSQWNVRIVTTGGGEVTKLNAFTITAMSRPAVTAISPAGVWYRNTTINYTITGTNFQPDNTVVTLWNASGTLLNASGSGIWLVEPTRIYGTVVVPYEAPSKTPYNVTITTVDGGSGGRTAAFTVGNAGKPTVTAITPAGIWARNATINYTITGTNFQPDNTIVTFWNTSGTLLNTSGAGVWLVEPTKIYGTVVVPYEAPSKTPYNVTVWTYDGGVGGKPAAFTVGNAAKPTVTAITPAGMWARNTTINYTITGTNFQPDNTEVTFWNTSGVQLNASGAGVWLVEPTKIYGTVVVPYEAPSKTPYNVTVWTYDGGVGGKAAAFTVGNAAKPTVTAISPAGVWARNTTINYTITGTNFQPDNTEVTLWNTSGVQLNASGAGVWLVEPTKIYGTVVVPYEAPSKTPYNITVWTYDGGVGGKPAAFTVGNAAKPTVTAITPAGMWARNTTINYTITGTNFQPDNTIVTFWNTSGTVLNASGSGVWLVEPTKIYGTVVVPYEAPSKTPYNITIRTYDGGVGGKPAAFTVGNAAKPTVTAISPAGSWARNTTINYTITGTNFQPDNTVVTFWNTSGTLLNASGSGVWLVEPTKIYGTVVVPYEAPSKTPYNITVRTYDGGVGGKPTAFTVGNAAKPTVTAITPAGIWTRNTTINYTITGTNFQPDNTAVTFWNRSGVQLNATGSGVWLVTPTKIYGTVVVPYEAPSKTPYNITVQTYDGGVGGKPAAFTVGNAARPVVTAISPSGVWYHNATVNYTITGANFEPENTIVTLWNSSGSVLNATGSGIWRVEPTRIYGTVVVPYEASSKTPYNITIRTYDGGVGGKAAAFTVGSFPAPAITAISPTTGYPNSTVAFTIRGTNFQPGKTAIKLSHPVYGEVDTTTYSLTSTQIIGGVQIPADATVGAWKMNVTTADGGRATVPFTVSRLPAPAVTSFLPNIAFGGTTVNFIISGKNFQPGDRTTVVLSRTGEAEIETTLNAVFQTRIAGSAVIPPGTKQGLWKVNVTTIDGGRTSYSNALTII